MADGPLPASGREANPAGALGIGFIVGGVGVLVSVAGFLFIFAVIISIVASVTRSPKARDWWLGTLGLLLGAVLVRLVLFKV